MQDGTESKDQHHDVTGAMSDEATRMAAEAGQTQPQAEYQTEYQEDGPVDYYPNAPTADAIDLAALIGQVKDARQSGAQDKALALTAEVFVPGLPDGKGGYGLKCRVKRFTPFEESQVAWKSRQGAQEPDDGEKFSVPEALTSPDARADWWRSIWRLYYGLTKPVARVLAAIATDGKDTTLNIAHLITWFNRPDAMLVTEPLLQGINLLNYYSVTHVPNVAIDGIKMEERVIDQCVAAYRNGELSQFLGSNAEVVQRVVEKAQIYGAIQDLAVEREAKIYARHNKEAIKQAVREILEEMWQGGAMPVPQVPVEPPRGHEAGE